MLPLAEDIATIERENGDWINYFWSSWGAAGKVGEGVMLVYDKLQDPGHTKALFKTFAESLATRCRGRAWLVVTADGLISRSLRYTSSGHSRSGSTSATLRFTW